MSKASTATSSAPRKHEVIRILPSFLRLSNKPRRKEMKSDASGLRLGTGDLVRINCRDAGGEQATALEGPRTRRTAQIKRHFVRNPPARRQDGSIRSNSVQYRNTDK